MKAKFNHPLMHENFTKNDFKDLTKFLTKNPVLTQSKLVGKYGTKGHTTES